MVKDNVIEETLNLVSIVKIIIDFDEGMEINVNILEEKKDPKKEEVDNLFANRSMVVIVKVIEKSKDEELFLEKKIRYIKKKEKTYFEKWKIYKVWEIKTFKLKYTFIIN